MSSGPTTSFSCDTRIGITFIAQSACLSLAAVVSLLSHYSAFRTRGNARHNFLRSHLDLYLLGLLLSDLIQSVGGIMDIRWIFKAGVFEGRFCTAQGALEQLGDVGVALFSMVGVCLSSIRVLPIPSACQAIATHTFAELILRWREPKSFTIPLVVMGLYAVFLTLIVGVGFAVQRNSVYYGNTTYWCWIKKEYISEGIGLEYLWLWIAAAMNILLYVPAFLALKRIIIVEPTIKWSRYRVKWTAREERLSSPARHEGLINPGRVLYYPAVYIVTVLPIAVVRIHAFLSTTVPFPATVFSGVLFSASGFFNVVVYTSTRPALLRPGTAVEPPLRLRQPVFFFPDNNQLDIDARSVPGGDDQSPQSTSRSEAPSAKQGELTVHM